MPKTRRRTKTIHEFNNVKDMLYCLAHGAKVEPRFSFEDAYGEAVLGFMKACRTYDPERGSKLSTWVYWKTLRHLKGCRKAAVTDPLVFTEMNDEIVGAAPAGRRDWLDLVEELSSDARELIGLLLETPKEILAEAPLTPEELLEKALEHLGFEKGWDEIYGKITIHEIRVKFEKPHHEPKRRPARSFADRCLRKVIERKRTLAYFRRLALA